MLTDPIADYLTRLRNAIKAKHRVVEIPASNIKKEITKVLFDKGYIQSYKFDEVGPQGVIKIALKYNPVTKQSAIVKFPAFVRTILYAIDGMSKPAPSSCARLRIYAPYEALISSV